MGQIGLPRVSFVEGGALAQWPQARVRIEEGESNAGLEAGAGAGGTVGAANLWAVGGVVLGAWCARGRDTAATFPIRNGANRRDGRGLGEP